MILALLAAANPHHAAPGTKFPGQLDLLNWCKDMGAGTAVLILLLGAVYLLYGWTFYKPLITLNAGVVGAYLGALLGYRAGSALLGGIMGGILLASIAYPMMKWSVAIIGGVVGAMFGATIWLSAGQAPVYAWSGALTGLVGFGLFAFILFRGSLIMYTSIQGGAMAILGLLGLAFKYPEMAQKMAATLKGQPLALPVAVLVATILGLIFQQTHSASAKGGGGDEGGGKKEK